jgi:hypothetical protein
MERLRETMPPGRAAGYNLKIMDRTVRSAARSVNFMEH